MFELGELVYHTLSKKKGTITTVGKGVLVGVQWDGQIYGINDYDVVAKALLMPMSKKTRKRNLPEWW